MVVTGSYTLELSTPHAGPLRPRLRRHVDGPAVHDHEHRWRSLSNVVMTATQPSEWRSSSSRRPPHAGCGRLRHGDGPHHADRRRDRGRLHDRLPGVIGRVGRRFARSASRSRPRSWGRSSGWRSWPRRSAGAVLGLPPLRAALGHDRHAQGDRRSRARPPGPAAVTASGARSKTPTPRSSRRLTKRYGDFVAVDALDLEVHAGEIFGLLGQNGAGKTTTILMLWGSPSPRAAAHALSGSTRRGDPSRSTPRQVPAGLGRLLRRHDRPREPPHAKLNGLVGTAADGKIAEALEQVGMTDRADTKTETYSRACSSASASPMRW